MKLPIQPDEIEEKRQAFAPYNFVPLPEKVVTLHVKDLPDQGVYEPGRISGYLNCELTTESPVYIRAGLNEEKAKSGKQSKDVPDFFFLDDENEPVIPGSSLRGMLRTLVEIVTYSKVSFVSEKKMVYRSVGGATNHDAHYRDKMMHFDGDRDRKKYYTPKILGGYMVKKGSRDWFIRPARVVGGTTYAHIRIDEKFFKTLERVQHTKNAFHVYIRTSPYDYQDVRGGFLKIKYAKTLEAKSADASGLRPAALVLSGWMNSKLSEAVIYEPNPDAPLLPLTDDQIDAYNDQISQEQKKLLGDHGVLNDGQPVFYILDEKTKKVEFFGHARMFRVPYPNSPFDYVPEEIRGSDKPFHPELVDYAEAMFGYTRKVEEQEETEDPELRQKKRAYAGRVNISDARLLPGQSDLWLTPGKTIVPKILSGPKATTFQHYLAQIEPDSYKIGETRDGRAKFETRLRDYASPKSETTIRGHKFYWQKGAVGLKDIKESADLKEGDTQHTKIDPLRAGVKFGFQINFENLSKIELGALLFVLEILAAGDKTRLKIGMGKPLGMGAVKIVPQLLVKNTSARYSALLANERWLDGFALDESMSQDALAVFLNCMKDELGSELTKTIRIKALLTLLQWPGPEQDADLKPTRYMEIEHPVPATVDKRGKRNEYKDRPVLPTPQSVFGRRSKLPEKNPARSK